MSHETAVEAGAKLTQPPKQGCLDRLFYGTFFLSILICGGGGLIVTTLNYCDEQSRSVAPAPPRRTARAPAAAPTASPAARLREHSLKSPLWKAVKTLQDAKDPAPSSIQVHLSPALQDSAAKAKVIFDLRPQKLDIAGYQLNWDTGSMRDEEALAGSFGEWKLRSGLVLLDGEVPSGTK